MEFKINDPVVHPQHGVGQIVKLEIRQFGSGPKRLYYEISIPNGSVWVPVDGSSCELRKLTPKGDLAKYRKILKSRPIPLAANYRERQVELADRMKIGSFQSRCEIVRDLTAYGWDKPLGEGIATILRSTHQKLDEEWALSEKVSLTGATREIQSLLLEGKQLYKK
jgi:RNA polymerase-interacting CarD/CdnL/TRCF family regulator